MGIRVVQRAFAPPSPNRYVPGGGKTTKEQAKINRKALLYGCRSTPLESKFMFDQEKSLSAAALDSHEDDHVTETKGIRKIHKSMPECEHHRMDTSENGQNEDTENKSPNHDSPIKHSVGHVTFTEKHDNRHAERIINGMANEQEQEDQDERNVDNGERRTPLKSTGPEDRMDSLESNEDTLSDFCRSLCSAKRPSMAAYLAGVPSPKAMVEKPFLLSDGKVLLSASLDKGIYSHGEDIRVSVQIRNNSNKTIRRIKMSYRRTTKYVPKY